MTTGRTGDARGTAIEQAPRAQPKLHGLRGGMTVIGALVVLWAGALWRLQEVWSHVPDYAFGWAVPVLAAFLLMERWHDRPALRANDGGAAWAWWVTLGACGVGLVFVRLLLEPFPTWPMMLWILTGMVVWVTLGLLSVECGGATARHFAFPFVFVATALPWPAVVNAHFVAPMREALAAGAAQVVNLLGYPAIARGTVIEVGRGFIGVEEACSGIRSLQAAIMVALFLGELNRFTWRRRGALLAVGIGLALASNGVRTLFLAWESAVHGPQAVAAWHDPAGYALLVVCLGGLVLTSWSWRKHAGRTSSRAGQKAATRVARPAGRLALAVVVACVLIEAGTQAWYAHGDREAQRVAQLTAQLPVDEPSFEADPFDATMQALLQCDTHQLGHWTTENGAARAGYVLGWQSGQSARFATALHNPTVCLPMSGSELVRERGVVVAKVGELTLPFRAFVFRNERGLMHVYYLQWDVRGGESFGPRAGGGGTRQWIAQQWREVRRARRNFEALVFTLAIRNARNDADADHALERELPTIVTVRRPAG